MIDNRKSFTGVWSVGLAIIVAATINGCVSGEGAYTVPGHTSAARHKATMRSYAVNGKTYRPTYVKVGDSMTGIASWYGTDFHGHRTSNGERYNMYSKTAAHKTWPMDTMVKVENLGNGKSTIVRINDRGPFVKGRIIDCSYAAGKEIGLDKTGLARVRITVLGFAGQVYRPAPGSGSESVPSVHLTDFGVQVGAFRRIEGANIYRRKYSAFTRGGQRVMIRRFDVNGMPLFRVWVMGFGSAEEARDFINRYNVKGGFLIRP